MNFHVGDKLISESLKYPIQETNFCGVWNILRSSSARVHFSLECGCTDMKSKCMSLICDPQIVNVLLSSEGWLLFFSDQLLDVAVTSKIDLKDGLTWTMWVLHYWDRSCRSNLLPHLVTENWRQASHSFCIILWLQPPGSITTNTGYQVSNQWYESTRPGGVRTSDLPLSRRTPYRGGAV